MAIISTKSKKDFYLHVAILVTLFLVLFFGFFFVYLPWSTHHGEAGQVVAVELTEPPSMFSQPVGRVVEVLGEIDDPGMEIEIAVRKYEVPHRFSSETLAQAAALPNTPMVVVGCQPLVYW